MSVETVVEQIKQLRPREMMWIVRTLQEEWGIQIVNPKAVRLSPLGQVPIETLLEPTEFDVHLTGDGGNKIAAIKVVREVLGLGLKEAKEFVESAPAVVKRNLSREDADALRAKLGQAGVVAGVTPSA